MNTFLETNLSPQQKQARKTRLLLWGKHLVFIILQTIAGLFLGRYLYEYFHAGVANSQVSPFVVLGWFSVFLVVFLLGIISIRNRKALTLLVFLPGLSVIGSFLLGGASGGMVVGGMLFLLFLSLAVIGGRWEIVTSVRVRFARTSSSIIGKTMLSFAILIAFVFFNVFSSQPLGEDNAFLPKSIFEDLTPTVSKAFTPLFGDIDTSLTLREAAEKAVDAAIEESSDRTIRFATPDLIRTQLINQSVIEFQNRIEESLGVRIDPDKKISEAIYEAFLSKFNSLNESSRNITLLIISVVIALVIQTSSIIFRIVIIPIAFVLYEMLLIIKFFKTTFESRDKEWITLE